jgi:NDP-sugar pyrophosphorylase family protein
MLHTRDLFYLSDFPHASLWNEKDCSWEALFHLVQYLDRFRHRIEIKVSSQVYLENKAFISIGKGTEIDPGVLIQGPCIIGENCKIRHSALLRPYVILGNGCSIGHGTEVKHSIFLNEAIASHLCYVGDSILGKNVNLGAGVKCSNFRFDGKKISFHDEGKKIETGLRKLGAILGDRVHVGCNSVLNPGTLVGKETIIYPLLNVGGLIGSKSIVKTQKNWNVEATGEKILEKLLQ